MPKRPSTEPTREGRGSVLVPNALPVAALPDALCSMLAGGFDGALTTAQLRAFLIDGERIARELRAASGAELAVVEAVAGAGGQISSESLSALLQARFGWREELCERFRDGASARGLLVAAGAQGRNGHTQWYLVLLAEVADQLARATLGLSLPTAAPPDTLVPTRAPAPRDRIARLAACAHFAVKAARNGTSANRATLRKLVAAIGADLEDLQYEYEQALAIGALRADGDLIVPSERVLRGLASGELAWDPDRMRALVRSWVPEDRWIAMDALVRAVALHAQPRLAVAIWAMPYAYLRAGLPAIEDAQHLVDGCVELAREVRGGALFVRRIARTQSDDADGHVTPNLEVMLGPSASADLALSVALAAEPVRFDRYLTFRLTPSSVGAAVACGLDATSILAALGRVGKHGVPDNVRAMVEDWARSARTAKVRAVWLVELSSNEAADVAARALGTDVVARPAPHQLLLDMRVANPELALAKAGVKVVGGTPHDETELVESVPVSGPNPALALVPPADNVAKFAQARKDGFPSAPRSGAIAHLRAGKPSNKVHIAGVDAERDLEDFLSEVDASPGGMLRRRASVARSPVAVSVLLLAGKLVDAIDDPLYAWIERRPAIERALALDVASEATLALVPLAALLPKWRSKLLREHRTIDGLIRASEKLFDAGNVSELGALVLKALSGPEANALWQADRTAARDDDPHEAPIGSHSPAATTPLATRPRAKELARQPSDEVRRLVEESAANATAVWALVSSKSQGDRVVSLKIERVLERGSTIVVLATDLEADEGRSFPLANIAAVRPQARSDSH